MARESREDVKRALVDLGWEVGADDGRFGDVVGGHGKHHVMVSFQDGEPVSVIISYVGKGGEMLSRGWPGVERLPNPQSVVRVFAAKR